MNQQKSEVASLGITIGGVRLVLRMEAMLVMLVSALAYAKFGSGWSVFFLCFFIPDIAFIGYLAGPRIGALTYNATHSYIGAMACLALAMGTSWHVPLSAALIWSAHIGFDRMLGYGLKYARGFKYTHLGVFGRTVREPASRDIKAPV